MHHIYKRSHSRCRTGHRGFTLIETLLAVAILLILVLVVEEGFVSTLHIASNTALFEKTGNIADSQANAVLSNTSSVTPVTDKKVNLHTLVGYSIDQDLSINKYNLNPPVPSGSQQYDSAHRRQVFTYLAP